MNFKEFKEQIINNYKSVFPNSACAISLGALGGDSAFVTYYLAGNQSEFPNQIAGNDLFHISFSIRQPKELEDEYGYGNKLTDDTELPDGLILEANQKCIATKPTNEYMAYGSVSLPFRKTVGNAEKIVATLLKYAEVTKKTLTELYELDQLPTNQQSNIKELVASKLGLNSTNVKTEGLAITGTWEPHPEIGKSYAYRLKHGMGGTLPNDVKIKKYEELNNGWTIVYLDRPLTYKELDFYDIPSETISMPEIDKFIDYKCMKGESKLQEDEDEIELQDVDNEEDTDEEETDEQMEIIEDLKNKSGFYTWAIEDIIADAEDYDGETLIEKIKARCESIMKSGCVSGIVGSLVYYSDTIKIFNEYADDIYDIIEDYGPEVFLNVLSRTVNITEIILNCDTSKNWIVWLAYEEVVYQVLEAIENM